MFRIIKKPRTLQKMKVTVVEKNRGGTGQSAMCRCRSCADRHLRPYLNRGKRCRRVKPSLVFAKFRSRGFIALCQVCADDAELRKLQPTKSLATKTDR
ncbi:unnamed protein product [Soboliphyme baturini]|uniref:60S ribosomal protein L34 n=1 Tax=Soboliphyme baturini TaxID=241478 RepID=A0A183IE13_9BILA|nr:unnamed protein product [Soboliphyme baturini]